MGRTRTEDAMSERLKMLIEKARHYRMSAEELTEQEISFAYGNAHFENERITREMVARALPASGAHPLVDNTAAG
jgi:hypothetical protein